MKKPLETTDEAQRALDRKIKSHWLNAFEVEDARQMAEARCRDRGGSIISGPDMEYAVSKVLGE